MANRVEIMVSPIGELTIETLIKDLETILSVNLRPNTDPHEEDRLGTFAGSYYIIDLWENIFHDPPHTLYEYALIINYVLYKGEHLTRTEAAIKFGWELWNELLKTERYAMMHGVEFGPILAIHGSPRPVPPENSVIAREQRLFCRYRGFDYLFVPPDSRLWVTAELKTKVNLLLYKRNGFSLMGRMRDGSFGQAKMSLITRQNLFHFSHRMWGNGDKFHVGSWD